MRGKLWAACVFGVLVQVSAQQDAIQRHYQERYGRPSGELERPASPATGQGVATGVPYRGIPYHPFRKVGERYYDLQPLYRWLSQPAGKSEKPMREWIGESSDAHMVIGYQVLSVKGEGLLVACTTYGPSVSPGPTVIFLKNYPKQNGVTDGQAIRFLAIKTGTHQYTDPKGATHTIELYDYGTPYSPNDLARSRGTQTNTTASTPRNTSIPGAP